MSKLLCLISVMLFLTTPSFCQKTLTKDNLQAVAVNKVITPGDYLIKAKNQLLGSFVCQFFAGGLLYLGTSQYSTSIVDHGANVHPQFTTITNGQAIRDACYVGAGILGVVGFGLEISGISNIGKAGVSLNENGIGLTVKF